MKLLKKIENNNKGVNLTKLQERFLFLSLLELSKNYEELKKEFSKI